MWTKINKNRKLLIKYQNINLLAFFTQSTRLNIINMEIDKQII